MAAQAVKEVLTDLYPRRAGGHDLEKTIPLGPRPIDLAAILNLGNDLRRGGPCARSQGTHKGCPDGFAG